MTNTSVLSVNDKDKELNLQVNVADAIRQLRALDPRPEARFDFRMSGQHPKTVFGAELEGPAFATWLQQQNVGLKRDAYFSLNAARHDAPRDEALSADRIGMIRAFPVDMDPKPDRTKEDGLAELLASDNPPTVLTDSGNGGWGYYLPPEPVTVESLDTVAQNKALIAHFDSDRKCSDIARITRLCGTYNWKDPQAPKLAKIVWAGGPRYTPAELATAYPPALNNRNVVKSAGLNNTPLVDTNTAAVVEACLSILDREDLVAVAGAGGRGLSIETLHALMDEGATPDMAAILSFHRLKTEGEDWELHDLKKLARGLLPSRKLAIGAASPEVEFTDETASPAAGKPARPPLLHVSAIKRDVNAPSRYLIEGLYDRNAFVVTYGESNTGKSNVVLNQALHIAAGLPWRGRSVKQGMVVYVAAEGALGLEDRVEAYKTAMPEIDWSKVPFYLWSFPADFLHSNADADYLIGQIKAVEAETGVKCVAAKLDTLSRLLAGGDENTSVDMGKMVMRCGRVQSAIGCTVHLVHHAGKNTAKGARGHSSLRAAVDTEIEIENKTIICRKQRDMDFFTEMRFGYDVIELPPMADGKARNSIVLTDGAASDFIVDVTPQTQKVWEAAVAIVTQKTQIAGADVCSDSAKLSPKELKALAVPERTIERALAELAESGMLVKCKRGLYKLNPSAIPPNFRQ